MDDTAYQVYAKTTHPIREQNAALIIENYRKFKSLDVIREATKEFGDMITTWSVNLSPVKKSHESCIANVTLVMSFCTEKEYPKKKFDYIVTASIKGYQFYCSQFMTISRNVETHSFSKTIFEKYDEKWLTGSSLVIDMKVEIVSSREYALRSSFMNPRCHAKSMARNFHHAYEKRIFTDFTFIVKGERIKAHKNIVSVSSNVFRRIFLYDKMKTKTNEFVIDDVEPKVFEQLLCFIYTGTLPLGFVCTSLELFDAAYNFQVTDLIEMYEYEMIESLTVENAIETYKWACAHNLTELRVTTWNLIRSKNLLDVLYPLHKEPPTLREFEKILDYKKKNVWKKIFCWVSWFCFCFRKIETD